MMKYLLLLSTLFLFGCANKFIPSLTENSLTSDRKNLGYLAINFETEFSNSVVAVIKNIDSEEYFNIHLNNPKQATNSVSIFGQKVWEEHVGEEVKIPINVIPLEPGNYQFQKAYVRMGPQSMMNIDMNDEKFTINTKEINYLGDFHASVYKFLSLFPIYIETTSKETDLKLTKQYFNNIPIKFNKIKID